MKFTEHDGGKTTVGRVRKTVVGKLSGMHIPLIEFSFFPCGWYNSDKFIDRLANAFPIDAHTNTEGANWREREADMKLALANVLETNDLPPTRQAKLLPASRYWGFLAVALKEKGCLEKAQIKEVKMRVRKRIHCRKMCALREGFGLVQRGRLSIEEQSRRLRLERRVVHATPDPRMMFVPPLDVRTCTSENLRKLKDVENKLEMVMRIRGGARKEDVRDSNRGVSLGLTTVSGGRHADLSCDVSGSIHMNRNLIGQSRSVTAQCEEAGVNLGDLQKEVIEVVSTIIEEAFGSAHWYKAAKDMLRMVPKERLLPSASIPASHIWWTSDPKKYHIHTDTNTIPPAFLVCASDARGGELCCLPPTGGVCTVETKPGTVVGGSWAQHPHCNAPVLQGDRHSFVVYLDKRNVSESYTVLVDY